MKNVLYQHRTMAVVFITVLVLTLVSTGYLWRSSQQSLLRYQEARSEFRGVAELLYQSSEEKEFLAENLGSFRARLKTGQLGEVAPMRWAEVFEELRVSLELDKFYYEINPPRSLEKTQNSSLNIKLVTIQFQSAFRHDEALFQFFNQLRNNLNYPFQISQLEVVRSDHFKGEEFQSDLKVIGEINWLSIVPLRDDVVGV